MNIDLKENAVYCANANKSSFSKIRKIKIFAFDGKTNLHHKNVVPLFS